MYLHKEGHRLLSSTFVIFTAITAAMAIWCRPLNVAEWILIIILWAFWLALASFFRIPKRSFTNDITKLISPADGHICNIEQTFEKEYLNSECIMVSVFMNGTDVHVNRYPTDGTVEYVKYHKGNYFIASHPKSSFMNERSSIGMKIFNGQRILIRQVAGLMARRIVCYSKEGDKVKQHEELGFIKFGSRVDLYLPLGTKLCVAMDDTVRNGVTPIAILE